MCTQATSQGSQRSLNIIPEGWGCGSGVEYLPSVCNILDIILSMKKNEEKERMEGERERKRDRQTDLRSIENSEAGRAGSATKVFCRRRQEDHKFGATLLYVLSSSIEGHKNAMFQNMETNFIRRRKLGMELLAVFPLLQQNK